MTDDNSASGTDQWYYAKEVYVCLECGDSWDTPGAAEICHKKDRILELVNEMDSHKTFALDEVIEHLERSLHPESDRRDDR